MSLLERVREACLTAWGFRSEGYEFNDLFEDDYSDEDLARLWLSVDEWRKTVNHVASLVSDEWVARHAANGAVEVDGFLVTTKKGYVKESCVDHAGFTSWALENPKQLVAAVNPNNVRHGSLPPAVRSTFFEKTTMTKPDSQPAPSAIPVELLNREKQ